MSITLVGSNAIKWTGVPSEDFTRQEVFFGRDETGVGEIQICTLWANKRPNRSVLEAAWKERGAGNAMPVMVAAFHGNDVWLLGPSLTDTLIGPVSTTRAIAQMQALLNERDGVAARKLAQRLVKTHESGGEVGFVNHFLFASHHLKNNVPARADWSAASEIGRLLISARGRVLIANLGFEATQVSGDSPNVLILRGSTGSRRAVAVLLDESEHFDQRNIRYLMSPVAKGLEIAGREDVPWVIVLRESTLRLYPGQDGVGVGQRGQAETYFELDLNLVEEVYAGLLPLIFSADALEAGGSADQILSDSGKYAAELGARLRDRVYENVVPQISVAIAERLPLIGFELDDRGLNLAYSLTLRVLFRLLFQAYGEDTGLLPAGRNDAYDANSLQTFIRRDISADASEYSSEARSIWLDLTQVWDTISNGNQRWAVPAYGGSLFDQHSFEGAALAKLELPDSVIGPVLQSLLSELTEEGIKGPVDFRSLQVRDFGTIYEGLLESSLSLAEFDLSFDQDGVFIPAGDDQEIVVSSGEPYFHSSSGARKATGSYYTPKLLVDHLVEKSVTPVLESHLAEVSRLVDSGKEREAAELFWDFRVADLAMGSAHFLVAAVDKIERLMRDFLTATPIAEVRLELDRLASKAREALNGDVQAASEINEAQLLRRQVARRCIYGLDINPLAVELARLAIWIHTFVPGLPMSSLDHNLVLGNSLTGIGSIEEALEVLDVGPLFEPMIRQPLEAARDLLMNYANASEADKREVAAGALLLAEASEAAKPVKDILDVATAVKLGKLSGESFYTQQAFNVAARRDEVRTLVEELGEGHMPFLFPEVFLRENPGFDALIGNPPWEVIKVEEQKWWGLRIAGVRSLPKKQMNEAIAAFRANRPDLEREFEAEIKSTDALRTIVTRSFPGLGAGGDPDLYQAFSWRNWSLLRKGGRVSLVLPRMAMASSSLIPWRTQVLQQGAFEDVCILTNTGKWIFEDVDGRYTVALVTFARSNEHFVNFAGPFNSEVEFLNGKARTAKVSAERFRLWSENLALPILESGQQVEIFDQMYKSPKFGDNRQDFSFKPVAELHATGDKAIFDFDLSPGVGRVPVLKGASFNLWAPDSTELYAYADAEELRDHLWAKMQRQLRSRASVYFGMRFSRDDLPFDHARIALRLITNKTNSRTTIVALLPPRSTAQHSAQFLFNSSSDKRVEAFLLGVLSSIPFDWIARKWVELNFTFEALNNMPVPQFQASDMVDRLVHLSGQLAATDERFDTWAASVGVKVGAVSESEQARSIAEIDALVAHLYGLNEEQVVQLFSSFHVGWDCQPRLDAVLEHFRKWGTK